MKRTGKAPGTGSNVVLFLYDSLIPSMLSGFGGSAPTPSFDFFINSGLSFSSASPHSLRSDVVLGSIFTGLYPNRSGIHKLYDGEVSLTGNGYFNEKSADLTAKFALSKYMVRLFNCDALNASIMRAARNNESVSAPHMDQLMNLLNESADDPFLLVDRFGTTAFGWRPDYPHDRRETDEEYRDLMLSGLSVEKGRRLVLRRMEDAVKREDARLGRFINLMHRHSLMQNTLVVLAGIPGDISKDEMEALDRIGGVKEGSPARFPLTFWYPSVIAPRKDTESMVRHIDILPTVLSICGIDSKDELDGRDLTVNSNKGADAGTLVFHDEVVEHYGGGEKSVIALESADSEPKKPTSKEKGTAVYKELGSPTVFPRRHDALLRKNIIPKKSIFFITLPRSGSTFFTEYFKRPEFNNVFTLGHNRPVTQTFHRLFGLDQIDKEKVTKKIMLYRDRIMSSHEEIYVSVSHNLWNSMDIISDIFVNAKFVIVMRDPVSQMVSSLRVPEVSQMIGSERIPHTKFGLSYHSNSKHFSDKGMLDRVTHFWNAVSVLYFNSAKSLGERAITVRFDEIFSKSNGHPGMKRIADFIDGEIRVPTNEAYLESIFSKKVNSFDPAFPAWDEWREEDRETLLKNTKEWRELWEFEVDA